MEDGDISSTEVSATINADDNKELMNTMANYPDVEVTVIKNKNNTDCKGSESCTKINGESEKNNSDEQEEYTSDEDALIIDEECKKVEIKSNTNHKRIRSPSPRANFKGFKKRIIAKSIHFLKITKEIRNTYCLDENETLSVEEKVNFTEDTQGELNTTISKESVTQNRNDSDTKTGIKDIRTPTDPKNKKSVGDSNIHTNSPKNKNVTVPSLKSSAKKTVKKRPSQKLTEYAQYLGLQPAVKFKCVKCSESSFPSLSALNEHQRQCLAQPPTSKPAPAPSPAAATPSSTNFRVTRKVFLCSSCGTYYENCNLFLHMREVHRRYICLYCLGMFSLPEKLSHHLVTKHNCSPDHYSSTDDFLSSYRESCFLVCCHCETVFSERDNFFHHVCVEKRGPASGTHPASCKANTEQPPSTSTHTPKSSSKTHQKSTKHKTPKICAKTPIAPAEHVTADSPSTSLMSAEVEPETNLAEHFMADVSSSCLKNEPESPEKSMSIRSNSPSPVENKDVNENTFEPEPLTNETDKNSSTEMASDVDKPVEDREEEMNEISENKNENEEDDKGSTTKSDIVEERKSDHDDDNDENNDNILPEDSSDSLNDAVSRTENNNSDVENMQCDNNLEMKNEDGNETNDAQSTSENKEASQISSDLDLSNNEEDEQIENCENINENDNQNEPNTKVEVEETRKVPKVTLKLPPQGLIYSENESEDSEKLTMEVDENCESDIDCEESQDTSKSKDEFNKPVNGIDEHERDSDHQSDDELYQIAGEDVPVVELELEQPLDKFEMESLLKICLGATIPMCVYCNHARKIAVNGKQLGLHAIAEHRFAATVNSITAEELIPKNFVTRIKESLDEVESLFFCLEEKEKPEEEIKEDGSTISSFKRIYECFQCRYVTTIHKELYLHNRKMHAKTILLCIMCKSNFYSYSELICHLCPGEYVLNSETKFRCCMCETNDLPSAFRLMVHLRKRHHTCDVCLEGCHNQSKLSNHVWKHKLHHLCYRCGIAYRNKPDITKHLFWKHGTESVLCKKCLQKKWPHVYHFCIPPVSFVCEECNLSFSKAVYLKVHKRLHINEKPHACTEEGCTETFISKKLLLKHEMKHREPMPIENLMETIDDNKENVNTEKENNQDTENSVNQEATSEVAKPENCEKVPNSPTKEEVKPKSIIDVYDLPALNLSESDSDSEEEKPKPKSPVETKPVEEPKLLDLPLPDINSVENETPLDTLDEEQKPVPILDGIWDNFKNYQATLEKKDVLNSDLINKDETLDLKPEDEKIKEDEVTVDINVIMADHDYCAVPTSTDTLEMEIDESETVKNDESTGLDHDYCTVSTNKSTNQGKTATPTEPRTSTPDNLDKKKGKSPKKKASKHNGSSSSSDSSSDSDSSSCTCGSNCSCSSSSGSSSSSSSSSDSDTSSSEGKRRIQARRERRKERAKRKKESETSHAASNTSAVDVVATEDNIVSVPLIELPILESDLDTDETETDEDFYDEHPQRLANKILAEKRNQLALLAAVAPVSNGTILECSRPSTPSIPEETVIPKKKVKSKKRKKKSRSSTPKQEIIQHHIPDYHHNHQSPLTIKPIIPVPPVTTPMVPSPLSIVHPLPTPHIHPEKTKIRLSLSTGSGSETEANVRSSKRRRVPNKFYGYSSDEEANEKLPATPVIKWRKSDLPAGPPQLVPPITIKNIPSPAPVIEPVRAPVIHHSEMPESDSDVEEVQHRKSTSDSSDSNRNDDSDSDTGQLHISQPPAPSYPSVSHHHHHPPAHAHPSGAVQRTNENLYCYCQCPYDEVSEMIACDGKECAIEWFHFECVGIMVPPKGKWFCPDCRKKSSSRSEFLQT